MNPQEQFENKEYSGTRIRPILIAPIERFGTPLTDIYNKLIKPLQELSSSFYEDDESVDKFIDEQDVSENELMEKLDDIELINSREENRVTDSDY